MVTDNNTTPEDNFNFDTFLSDESKKEITPEQNISDKTEEAVVETPAPQKTDEVIIETKVEDSTKAVNETKSGEPVRAPNEPDWKYDYRQELWQKQQELESAKTDSERGALKGEMDRIRTNIAQRSKADKVVSITDDTTQESSDTTQIQDLDAIVSQKLAEREYIQKLDEVEATFLERHPDVKAKEKYDFFFKYIGDTYNLRGKTPKQVSAILEMAHEMIYPNMVENKVANSKKLDEKLAAVDFSGSSTAPTIEDPVKDEGRRIAETIKKNGGNDWRWAVD